MQSLKIKSGSSGASRMCRQCVSGPNCHGCVALGVCPISKLPAHVNQQVHRSAETRFYTPGCIIACQGQLAKGVFIIKAGWVKTVFQTRSDRRVAVGLYGPGNVLALADVITGGRFSTSIETIDDCEIEFLSNENLRSIIDQEPGMALHLLQMVSDQFLRAMEDIREGAGVSTSDRLLQVLCDLAAQCGRDTGDGVRMRLPFTVQHLADRVGCSRQWATKALGELEEKGLVHRTRGWITVTHSAVMHGASPLVPAIIRVAAREV